MKNSDSRFFEILCFMLLMLVTSWPSFWSSNFSSSRSTEWWILRSTTRNGLSCLSCYVWKLAFRFFNNFVNFLYASGLAGRTFTLFLLIFNLYSSLPISFWIVFVIDGMSMTSSMKIGRRGGVFWVCCVFTASVMSIASSVASSIANLLWVVTCLAGGIVRVLLALFLLASSLRFFVRWSFAKRGV